MTKNISNKPKYNIILYGKKLDAFPLISRKACFFSSLIFNSIVQDLPNAIREGNKTCYQLGREKIKVPLFADDITYYIENPLLLSYITAMNN